MLDTSEREKYITDNIVKIASDELPYDIELKWSIKGFEHDDYLSYVEVEPSPSEAGYERFKIVVSFKDPSAPKSIAVYCFEKGEYSLLSYSSEFKINKIKLSDSQKMELLNYLKTNNKISAIKLARQRYNLNLTDAKQLIDALSIEYQDELGIRRAVKTDGNSSKVLFAVFVIIIVIVYFLWFK
ncbi:hypothetical protein MCHI_002754 [Candidatus Magnetoovum chiemensis]|nr:hypothetical protein MCHI_002754 [Candidatus Magnetoovum chiemensis]